MTIKRTRESGRVKFQLVSKDGSDEVLGTHDTRAQALAQERAIHFSKARRRAAGQDTSSATRRDK